MKAAIRGLFGLVLVWSLTFGARAETHALIMTIGAYKGGIPQLQGVRFDGESAKQIAKRMGVKDENMRFYKDDQLTLDGMRKAFAELENRVAPGDQVFIYYSGHGTRAKVRDPEERCATALVTVNGEAYTDVEMSAELRRLNTKAQKIIALLDACHSGGVTTRSSAAAKSSLPFSSKFAPRSGADACERPVNVLTRSISAGTRSVGSGANNYVYIAAARDNEVSLDDSTRGGFATTSWLDCLKSAPDRDGSGGLSAEEIRVCAQDRINGRLKGVQGFLPHNITITGNQNSVLAFAEGNPTPPPAPVVQPPKPPSGGGAPSPVTTALPPAYYTLADVANNRDDHRVVRLTASKPAFKVGVDEVGFTLNSSHAGYVYLLMVGSDGKAFDMLFPNQLDSANAIDAGQTIQLPRPAWQIKASGPAGKNYLLEIVAESPRDFSKIGMQPAGPFSMVAANQSSSKDIQLVSGTSSSAGASECSEPPAKRTLQVQRRCSNAYGAAMVVLEEVN